MTRYFFTLLIFLLTTLVNVGLTAENDEVSDLMNQALYLLHDKSYEEAITLFDKIIEIDPQNSDAFKFRGDAYFNLYDYNHSIDDYNKVISMGKATPPVYHNRGLSYLYSYDYHNAIVDFIKVIQMWPNLQHGYISRGDAYCQRGDIDLALNDYNKALEISPGNVESIVGRGNCFRLDKKYKNAINEFNEAIKLFPNYSFAYIDRGRTYLEINDYKNALSDFQKALTLYPESHYAYYCLGNYYSFQNEYDKAIENYNKAISIYPKDAYYYHMRGLSYYFKNPFASGEVKMPMGDLNESFEDYNKYRSYNLWEALEDIEFAISLNPNVADFYVSRGNIKTEKDQYDEAVVDYSKAIEMKPNDYWYYFKRGLAYYKKVMFKFEKNYETDRRCNLAIADFNKSIELNPSCDLTYYWLGEAYEKLQHFDMAINIWSKGLKLDPKDTLLLSSRALAYYYLGKYQNAINDFNSYLKIYAQSPDTRLKLKDAEDKLKLKMKDLKGLEGKWTFDIQLSGTQSISGLGEPTKSEKNEILNGEWVIMRNAIFENGLTRDWNYDGKILIIKENFSGENDNEGTNLGHSKYEVRKTYKIKISPGSIYADISGSVTREETYDKGYRVVAIFDVKGAMTK